MVSVRRAVLPAVLLVSALVATACAATPASASGLPGAIAPLVSDEGGGWKVDAWALGPGEPEHLASATADGDGGFALDVTATEGPLYVEARAGGAPAAPTLSAVVAFPEDVSRLTLNERTTVAAGYALAQFFGRALPSGSVLGMTNAARMAANLADPQTGDYGAVLTSAPNGDQTTAEATFTSLTNILGGCLADGAVCEQLHEIAAGLTRVEPESTAASFAAIARDPGPAASELYELSLARAGDRPGLSEAPAAWTIALRFDGDGQSLGGPGNFALDAEGDIWVNNNYQYDADPQTGVCGSDEFFEFGPDGSLLHTYSGGGLSGSGFGIDFDPQGRLWFSNFGFAAPVPGCPEDEQPPHDSMSLFTQDGTALSPAGTGFTQGDLFWPQGIEVSGDGSVWIANCGSSTVSLYPQGDPDRAVNLGSLGLQEPFDVVENGTAVFVTGNMNDTVAVIGPDGTPLPGSPLTGSFDAPMGLATDKDGNVWVANSGGISLPCPDRTEQGPGTPSLVMISPDGTEVSPAYTGGGLLLPWGITTDGDGNVWAANFNGKRIAAFCGADAATCPRGLQTGDPISPEGTGYAFEGLTRSTGIMVDTAGNVWVTNNWIDIPVQTNPGGHQIVAYVGAAAPVDPPVFE
ncbi:NHL repeat-containing protein [Microbacterium sp. GXF7504]